MKYLIHPQSEDIILSATTSPPSNILYTTPIGSLFFNDTLITLGMKGHPKFYKNEHDLATVSCEDGFKLVDLEKAETIYTYEGTYGQHCYDKGNVAYCLDEMGVCKIDLRKKYPVKGYRMKEEFEDIKCVDNKIYLKSRRVLAVFDDNRVNYYNINTNTDNKLNNNYNINTDNYYKIICRWENIQDYTINNKIDSTDFNIHFSFTKDKKRTLFTNGIVDNKIDFDLFANVDDRRYCLVKNKNILEFSCGNTLEIKELKRIDKIFFGEDGYVGLIESFGVVYKIYFQM